MARIRTIKPSFFRHRELFDAEVQTGFRLQIAFAGLWTCADREGRFAWRPDELKLDCLPYDNVNFGDVLGALEQRGFINRYEVDGKVYGCIPSWKLHQYINQREANSDIPEPPPVKKMAARKRTETHVHIPRGVNIPAPLRKTIIARDRGKCVRCPATEDLTVDHIFPRSVGGTHAITNLRTLCRPCNSARPVQGDALIADLARDGLTFDDMHRLCMHVQAPLEGEGKGKEEDSVAKATGADAPLEPPTESDLVWGDGLRWLASSEGRPADALRSMLGRWCKVYGDGHVLAALSEARSTSPPIIGPVAWIEAHLKARNRDGNQHRRAQRGPSNGFVAAALEAAS